MTITNIKIRKIFPENAFRDGVMAILSIKEALLSDPHTNPVFKPFKK